MEKELNSPFSFYLTTSIIILYVWRLVPFGDFFNVFIALSIILGLKRNNLIYLFRSGKIPWLFIFIISGIFISILYNSILLGSFEQVFQNNQNHTSLKFKSIIEGIGLFMVLILNINSKFELQKFLKLFLFSGVFFNLLWLLGLSATLIPALGFELYLESSVFISSEISYERFSFETLDENTFGSICCLLILLAIHYSIYSSEKYKKILYSLFVLMLIYSVMLTISRTVISRLILQTLFYLFFAKILSKRLLLFLSITLSPLIIYFLFKNPFTNITYRFNEFYLNMMEWSDTGSLYVRDSFQYRIIRSLLGVPDTISGWIFGSGGKQTARFYNSADHIEYTNWLWQYGLITFIPMIIMLIFIIYKCLNNYSVSKHYKSMNSVGAAMLFGMMISMLGNPQYYYLWITICISLLVAYFFSDKIVNE